jgi:hypothetical protein
MGWSYGTNGVNKEYSISIAKILATDRLAGLGVLEKYKLHTSYLLVPFNDGSGN